MYKHSFASPSLISYQHSSNYDCITPHITKGLLSHSIIGHPKELLNFYFYDFGGKNLIKLKLQNLVIEKLKATDDQL